MKSIEKSEKIASRRLKNWRSATKTSIPYKKYQKSLENIMKDREKLKNNEDKGSKCCRGHRNINEGNFYLWLHL